jgi:kumamolisin
MSQQLVPLRGTLRPHKPTTTRRRDANPDALIRVTVTLRSPALPDADNLPSQGMSFEDFAAKFGASKSDGDKVEQVLGGFGLKPTEVSLGTSSITFEGTVAQMEAAFGTKLGIYYNADQGEFRGREGDELQIPADLNGIVTGVFGLDQRRVAKRGAPAAPAPAAPAPATPAPATPAPAAPVPAATAPLAATFAPLTPADIERHYNFPAGDATGQTIAIGEFGGGYFADDLAAYADRFGRAIPQVQLVPVDLQPMTLAQILALPQDQQTSELHFSAEVNMDVQIVAGLCPGAKIVVYFATFTEQGWVGMLNQVLQLKPVTFSVSFGLAEDDPAWSAASLSEVNKRLNAASVLGITVCVSTGDDGSDCDEADGHAHVEFPASSQYVLSVGGTMLTGSSLLSAQEVVWWQTPGERVPNQGGGATGGGVSTVCPRPAFQNVRIPSVNSGSFDGRVVPDVSALAGPPFYDLIFREQDSPNGGTSAAAPLWASLIARINALLPAAKQGRFFTALLYQPGPSGAVPGQSGFNDITSGNNITVPNPGIGYTAGVGFDAASGWGTPDGVKLLNSL